MANAKTKAIIRDRNEVSVGVITEDFTLKSGKILNVSAGTFTLANDQISGDKVEGGTINAITINTLTTTTLNGPATLSATTVNATTFDTNVAAAAVTLSGTTLSADGTDADININITAKGAGQVIIDDLSLSTDLSVAHGGTGVSTLAIHGIVLGNAANAVNVTAAGVTGEVLIGNTGADPSWSSIPLVTSITATTGYIATLDTNVAAAGVTLAGTTLAADGTDVAIPITITPKGAAGIETAGGAVGTPAYTFTGDADTGMYRVGANQIGFTVGGVLHAVINGEGLAADEVHPRVEPGTEGGATITAVTNGDGRNFTTQLTLTATPITIGDNAALAVGVLVYTLPAGAQVIDYCRISCGLTAADAAYAADTPEIGLGTTLAAGPNATLTAAGATTENLIEGTAIADCTGTAYVETTIPTAAVPFVTELLGAKTLYLNFADTWANGASQAATITGTITIKWTQMS